jgi:hypothetical protein
MQQVAVVIPVYQTKLSTSEQISLRQCQRVLGKHPIILVAPEELNTTFMDEYIESYKVVRFPDRYFISPKTYNHLLKISPFGGGNVNPLFITQNAKILEIKSISNGKHCKLKFTEGDGLYISANAWRRGHYSKEFQVNDIVDLVFTMEIDTFTGRNNLILIIEDMKHSSM